MSFDYLFKCILIGNSSVGKSSILLKYLQNKFNNMHDITIGVEFGTRMIHVKNKILKIHAWDTAGQECFKSITKSYYRNASAIILVFDVTDENSFENLDNWMKDVDQMTTNPVAVLIGNKIDLSLHRKISHEVATQYAIDRGMHYYEISAKDQKGNIDEIFELIANEILTKIENGQIDCLNPVYGVIPGHKSDKLSIDIDPLQSSYSNPFTKCC